MTSTRLAAVDEAYLVVESPNEPLHVGSIGIFEGPGLCDENGKLRLEDVRRRVEARLGLLPRLRQRVQPVPLDLARPSWVDDPDFDVANHIDAVDIGPDATDDALLTYVERLMMEPLDRARPLWHLRLVTGLADGAVALVQRAHHAMIDGVSGVDVSITLLDAQPDAIDEVTQPWHAAVAAGPVHLVVDGVRDSIAAGVDAASEIVDLVRRPRAVVDAVSHIAAALRSLARDGVRAPACSLNAPLGGSRRIELVRQRLDAVRAIGASYDATVNDVVLTAVAGGLRSLFLARGEPMGTDRTVHVLVPVSVRADDGSPSLGNQVGGLVVALPIGIGDPEERLRAIASHTRAAKASGEASVTDGALRVLDLLPPPVAHLVQRSVDHQPFVNMVVTNIPGPPFPLYALGSRMLEAFPIVPLGAGMTLEVAVLSYDGALTLGVMSDRTACPDAPTFTAGLEASFASLVQLR